MLDKTEMVMSIKHNSVFCHIIISEQMPISARRRHTFFRFFFSQGRLGESHQNVDDVVLYLQHNAHSLVQPWLKIS